MSLQGACVFAGNNARQRGIAYRVNGQLIGYESARTAIKGKPDRMLFTITPLLGGPVIVMQGPSKIRNTPVTAWEPKDGIAPLPGKLAKEDMVDGGGNLKMRADSSAVFRVAAQGLKQLYPGTVVEEFSNVHDDKAEGGTKVDSLENFMEALEDCAATTGHDFFAYSGHGNGRSLPSAGLEMKSKEYRKFVEQLKLMLKPGATVIFYACCTGVEGGMAQSLSADLPGVTVWGHMSAGHGMTNPQKARCLNGRHEKLIDLLGQPHYDKWVKCIKDAASDIWRRYPWMTIEQIRAEVAKY